jgi:hypothetical protein
VRFQPLQLRCHPQKGEGIAELKRMYIQPTIRKTGGGTMLLKKKRWKLLNYWGNN